MQLEPGAFPTEWEIQRFLSRLHRDKVPGPNQIPPGVLKAGGPVLAKQLAILYMKASAHCKEPLPGKEDALCRFGKAKMHRIEQRPIGAFFVSNYTAKLYHQCIRTHLVEAWEQSISHLQCGGRAGVGADVAHHILQCHQAWTASISSASAVLFLDIRSAFYTVLRQAFTAISVPDQAFVAAMMQLGIQPDDLAKMLHVAQADNASQGISAHHQELLNDLMSNTYFTLPGNNAICQTTRGTRPGDPVADVLYSTFACDLSFRTSMPRCQPARMFPGWPKLNQSKTSLLPPPCHLRGMWMSPSLMIVRS